MATIEEVVVPLCRQRGAVKYARIVFMDEAPSEKIQPKGWPFVARIEYPPIDVGCYQYIVANESEMRDIKAWDEEKGPEASIEDIVPLMEPMDFEEFRGSVIEIAKHTDPRDWVRAMR